MGTKQVELLARDTKVIAGIQKRLQGMTIVILGVSYSAAQLVAIFQSHIDALNALAALRGQVTAGVQAAATLTEKTNAVFLGIQSEVRNQFNNAPDVLSDLGMTPKKVGTRSPVTNVVAAVKGRATRTRRGTTGSAEKAKVTGGLTPAEIQAAVAAEVAPVVGASEAQTAAASATSASATPAVAGSGTPRQ